MQESNCADLSNWR